MSLAVMDWMHFSKNCYLLYHYHPSAPHQHWHKVPVPLWPTLTLPLPQIVQHKPCKWPLWCSAIPPGQWGTAHFMEEFLLVGQSVPGSFLRWNASKHDQTLISREMPCLYLYSTSNELAVAAGGDLWTQTWRLRCYRSLGYGSGFTSEKIKLL